MKLSEEQVLRQWSRAEALGALKQFHTTGLQLRHLLLQMYEHGAHTALGYQEFSAFVEAELSERGSFSADYLRRLRMWARVERDLAADAPNANLLHMCNKTAIGADDTVAVCPVSARLADQLVLLSPDERVPAFREAMVLSGTATPADTFRDIRNIVKRRLREADERAVGTEQQSLAIAPATMDEPVRHPKPSVTTFTPSPDPEPLEQEDEPDWEAFEEAVTELARLIQARSRGEERHRHYLAAKLRAIAAWLQEE